MFARALLLALLFALVAGVVPARAEAAWTTLGSGRGGVFLACKTPENGGYGPVWKVTLVLATAQGGPQAAARFTVRRPQAGGWFSTVATVDMAAAGGAWDVRDVYASQLGAFWGGAWHRDQYAFSLSFYPQTGDTGSGAPERRQLLDHGGMSVYESAVRPLLFRLDAERAHNLTLAASELGGRSSLVRRAAGQGVHLQRPAAGDVAGRAPAGQPARARRRVRQERARGADARRAGVRAHRDRLGVRGRLGREPEAAAVPRPAGRGDRRRLWRAQRGRPRGARAPGRPAPGAGRREPGQDQRPRQARRRARGLRGLRRLVRRAAGPRGLHRAEPELPELGRRPRLLRRAAADRRVARPARPGRPPRPADPQAQADPRRRRPARDRGDRRRPPVRLGLRDQPAVGQAGLPEGHRRARLAREAPRRGRRPAGRGLRQRHPRHAEVDHAATATR